MENEPESFIPDPDPLLTQFDMALLVRCDPVTVERWRARGKGPAWHYHLDRGVVYRRSAVLDWLHGPIVGSKASQRQQAQYQYRYRKLMQRTRSLDPSGALRLLPIKNAARWLGVSVATLHEMRARGEGPIATHHRAVMLFVEASVLHWRGYLAQPSTEARSRVSGHDMAIMEELRRRHKRVADLISRK